MNNNEIINLKELEQNKLATIVTITAGDKATKRLADLGLTPHTPIKIIRKIHSQGPIELRVRGSNLILGRGLVTKILVKKYE